MPIYDYQCSHCNATFAVRKSMSEIDTPTTCPDCESRETQRLISVVAIFASGSGGQKRVLAGASSCSGCATSGTGCAGCHPR